MSQTRSQPGPWFPLTLAVLFLAQAVIFILISNVIGFLVALTGALIMGFAGARMILHRTKTEKDKST